MNEKTIEKWVEDGTITREQADKMLNDLSKTKKEVGFNKIILAISVIGSIFIGVSIILFVASNWEYIPGIIKLLILLAAIIGTFYTGYYLKYQRKNMPMVGEALIFLSTLVFGAGIFLTAQMYNINANSHILVLIWLIFILPLVYIIHSIPVTCLTALLFYIWIGLFMLGNSDICSSWFIDVIIFSPPIYLLSGIFLFGFGGLNYLSGKLKKVARVYRLAGIKVAMLSLIILTFKLYSELLFQITRLLSFFFIQWPLIIISLILSILNLVLNASKSRTNLLEYGICLALIFFIVIFFFLPNTGILVLFLFNIVLVGIGIVLIYVGYSRFDIKLVNTGIFWLSFFVLIKYFDFFFEFLDRAFFFFLGGIILVVGGIYLEKYRRKLKKQFQEAIEKVEKD